jgi:DNA primase
MISGTNLKRKLYQYYTQRLGLEKYRKGWLKGDCPECGKRKWGVNLHLMRTNCFSCGYNNNPIDAIADSENLVERNEVYVLLKSFEGLDFYEEKVELYQQKTDVSLPEGYRNIKRGDSRIARAARSYVKKRGFDIEELSRAGFGYCTEGKYFGYLIMPFYRAGKLVYFNARKFMGTGTRFNNPLIEDFGIGKSMLMYNIDCLNLYDRVFITEGLMNARTIGENATAMGGKKVSNYQVNLLIKAPVRKYIIGFDKDGYEDAIKLALKLQPYKKVKIMPFEDERDINDLGRKKSLLIANRQKYLSYNDIIKLKNAT